MTLNWSDCAVNVCLGAIGSWRDTACPALAFDQVELRPGTGVLTELQCSRTY